MRMRIEPNVVLQRVMRVFVTVGSTRFDRLVAAVLGEEVQQFLAGLGYTDLTVQYGNSDVPAHIPALLSTQTYTYKPSLLGDIAEADLVISHAGAGTCLEVLQSNTPLVVVVNTHLMDNHQAELAERLTGDGHLTRGTVDTLVSTLQSHHNHQHTLVPYPRPDPTIFSKLVDDLMAV